MCVWFSSIVVSNFLLYCAASEGQPMVQFSEAGSAAKVVGLVCNMPACFIDQGGLYSHIPMYQGFRPLR